MPGRDLAGIRRVSGQPSADPGQSTVRPRNCVASHTSITCALTYSSLVSENCSGTPDSEAGSRYRCAAELRNSAAAALEYSKDSQPRETRAGDAAAG